MRDAADAIEFWFDFGSGYAYFAHLEVARIERETARPVLWRPFMLGTAFKVTGAQGLSQTPMKGEYARRDWQRLATAKGVPFDRPGKPVIALAPSRIFYGLEECDAATARRFAERCFAHGYGHAADIATDEVLVRCLEEAGAPSDAITFARDPRLKDLLKARSEEAIARGVFGSPFFIWRDEPFWGADRIDMLIAWIKAHDAAERPDDGGTQP
ncbi:MAG: 2-hydroxychromene-2-carboxylate isomerase [Hyphomicrobiaceae bacterium]|nr:2-hydroxychromene-2-carboxylate isomerase [Hyphomicrobiaceae bacterium]